jgi:hypothetical protein
VVDRIPIRAIIVLKKENTMTKYQVRHTELDNDLSVTFTVWASDYDSALEQAVTILTTKYYPTITRAQILGDHLGANSAEEFED